jgi:hypothetical protein
MNEDTELQIASEVYEEILHNTDRKNYLNVNERILRKSMVALVKSGHAAFLFLRDDESRKWWGKTVKVAAATVEKRKEAWRLYEIKQRVWDRLSEADRKILKIRKPTMPKTPKPND